MVEQAASVRAHALAPERKFRLSQSGGKGHQQYSRGALEAAKNACLLRLTSGNAEGGESLAGAALEAPEGIDASGKKITYKRKGRETDKPGFQSKAPRRNERDGAEVASKIPQEDSRTLKGMPFPKCNGKGHTCSRCKFSAWRKIPLSSLKKCSPFPCKIESG